MTTRKIEIWVGVFMLATIAAFLFLAFKVASGVVSTSSTQYQVTAIFDNIGGLKPRSPVKLGGVVIGRVESIELDNVTLLPKVTLSIEGRYNQLPSNSSLAILTSGLLGEQFLGVSPGFVDEEEDAPYLVDGATIEDTHSALVLEDLIGQFLYSDKEG